MRSEKSEGAFIFLYLAGMGIVSWFGGRNSDPPATPLAGGVGFPTTPDFFPPLALNLCQKHPYFWPGIGLSPSVQTP